MIAIAIIRIIRIIFLLILYNRLWMVHDMYIHVDGLGYNFQIKLYYFPLKTVYAKISIWQSMEMEQFTNHSILSHTSSAKCFRNVTLINI